MRFSNTFALLLLWTLLGLEGRSSLIVGPEFEPTPDDAFISRSSHPLGTPTPEGGLMIYSDSVRFRAVQLNAAGAPVNPPGFPFPYPTQGALEPLGLFSRQMGGSNVVDFVAISRPYWSPSELRILTLHPEGHTLDSRAHHMEVRPAMKHFRVAAGPGGFLVVWEEVIIADYVQVRALFLDHSGNSQLLDISASETLAAFPAVVWDGARYLVVWHEPREGLATLQNLYGRHVSAAGGLMENEPFLMHKTSNRDLFPTIAKTDDGVLLSWVEAQDGAPTHSILASLVRADGLIVGPSTVAVVPSSSSYPSIDLTPFGEGLALNVNEANAVHLQPITNGILSSPIPLRSSHTNNVGGLTSLNVAGKGLLLWHGSQGLETNVAVVAQPQDASSAEALKLGMPAQRGATLVPQNGGYLLGWTQGLSNSVNEEILVQALGSEGSISSADPLVLARPITPGYQTISSDIVSARRHDGTVVFGWSDASSGVGNIYVSRVTPDGALLDPGVLRVSPRFTPASSPAVAFGPEEMLVLWQEQEITQGNWLPPEIAGALLHLDGAVKQGFRVTSRREAADMLPIAVSARSNYFGLYYTGYFDDSGTVALTLPFGEELIKETRITNERHHHELHRKDRALATDGTNAIVSTYGHAVELSPAGEEVGSFVIFSEIRSLFEGRSVMKSHALAFDGVNLIAAAVIIPTNAVTLAEVRREGSHIQINRSWVSRGKVGPPPLGELVTYDSPTLAFAGDGSGLLVYEDTSMGVSRLKARRLTRGADPLRINTIEIQHGQPNLSWRSEAGSQYVIESRASLIGGSWEKASPEIDGTGADVSWLAPAPTGAQGFYRVRKL